MNIVYKAKGKLISVIIPVYNREAFLDKCISSVLNQKDVETEIILIDDGSTDKSSEIIERYAEMNSNIVTIHQKNQGVSAARNAGLDICNGDYIFFLDSDDSLPEDSLINLLNAITEFKTDICIGNHCRFYENGEVEYQNEIPDSLKNKIVKPLDILSLMYMEYSYLWVVAWGKLYKRNVFDKIRFPYGLNHEDEYIIPDIMELISTAYLLDKNVYFQTVTKNSIVRNPLSVKKLDSITAEIKNINYYMDKKYYSFALYRFGSATRQLIEWKNETDDIEIQNEIKRHYKLLRIAAIRLMTKVAIQEKLRMLLFCLNFRLYEFVRIILRD